VDWEDELDSAWTTATHAAAAIEGAPNGPPQGWDGYEIKLARLRKVTRRLHELLAPVGATAELITEKLLSAADGRLRGQPDLIVRFDKVCWLLDYKTGPVLSHDTRTPRESYVRQLRLYAYLAAITLGEWPDRTFLMPLQGDVVEVDINPDQCTALAQEALDVLASFNAANGEQPASPAPETCRWCPYAPRCSAFWDKCGPEWAPGVLAAMGTVEAVTRSRLGGVSVILRAEAGSLAGEPVGVRSISITAHPAVAEVEVGHTLAIVGLQRDRHADSFSLPPSGRIWAHR
jgi:CRISPR/Cas system-associated exonuclease Cas4 (RecB family)